MKRVKYSSSESDSEDSSCNETGYPDEIPEKDRDAITRRSRFGPPGCTMHDYDIIGTLDYGVGTHYRELNEFPDERPVWQNNGVYMILAAAAGVVPFISVSTNWSNVDQPSEDLVLVQRRHGNPIYVCEGNVPCISSATENSPAPNGKWWHGQTFSMQRIIRRDQEDLLHVLRDVPGVEYISIFLVASIVPLRLIELTKPKQ